MFWSRVGLQSVYQALDVTTGEVLFFARFLDGSKESLDFAERLKRPSVLHLQRLGHLVDFEVVSAPKNSPIQALQMIKIMPIPFSSSGAGKSQINTSQLSFFTIKESARKWLDINRALQKDGLALIDSHLANFAYDEQMTPVWIDLDSIVPIRHGAEGLIEFRRVYVRPLRAMIAAPAVSEAIRALRRLNASALRQITKIPSLSWRGIEISSGILVWLDRKFDFTIGDKVRGFLLSLSGRMIPRDNLGPKTYWAHYIREKPYEITLSNEREKVISEVFGSLNYQSVMDIGGNDGRFLWLATRGGEVPGELIDPEDRAVSSMIAHIRSTTNTHDETGLVKLVGRVGGLESITHNADLVLALALTHHLLLSQQWTFDRLVEKLSAVTGKYLLVEWMPKGVGLFQMTYPSLPSWYKLEGFLEALELWFSEVSVIENTLTSNRVLILAKK